MSHDVISVLLDILVVLVAAKAAAELAERISVPPVVGEIVAGIVVGPSVLGLVGNGDVLRTLGELGVVLLLLEVGMEMDLAELGRVGTTSMAVATIGVVSPLVLGLGAMLAIGDDFNTALFVASALTATSVGITARVFGDLGALSTSEARVVLGAAVADDVMGLIVLTVVVRVVTEGTVSVVSVLLILLGALAFLIVGGAVALWLAPHLFSWLERISRSAGTLVALALAFTLAFAELADVANLAVVVGAFIAGLALGRTRQAGRIRRELAPVGHLFVPVFFLAIGIDVDISAFGQLTVLRDAAILLVVAVIGKLLSAYGTIGTRNDRLLVGLGMLPRGEVGLIFATIGLNAGVLGDDLYAALLLVVLATTLGTPMLLRARSQHISRRAAADDSGLAVPEPPGGWFTERDSQLAFVAQPGPHRTLELALAASRLVARIDPAPELLDWFAEHRTAALPWSGEATDAFLALLRDGNGRSWRFLDALDVLPRALPELEGALRDRRDDPFLLDPTGLHRWETLERLHEFVLSPAGAAQWERCRDRDAVRLVAFLVDVFGDRDDRVASTRRLVQRLQLGVRAEAKVAILVEDPRLLVESARHLASFDEQRVGQLAAHYGDAETARAAFILAGALTDGSFDRQALSELYGLVHAVLKAANWDRETANVVERRRREAEDASDGSDAVVRRIEQAPRAYLLAERPRRVARHMALASAWRRRGANAYLVDVEPPTRHDPRVEIEVVAPDRPGLLARVTHVLGEAGLDIRHAIVATWPDGCALESFLIAGGELPDAAALRESLRRIETRALPFGGVPDAEIDFDDGASPWHTVCRIRARDASGLLGAVTAAIAAAGVDVHSAEIASADGVALDTFELTGARGRLLPAERAAVVDNLRQGGVLDRPPGTLHRLWGRMRASWASSNGQTVDIHTSSV
jgi:Kef-type K+ transport system membrane component KefB